MVDYERQYKIVMVGNSGVGKTNILLRYVSDESDSHSKATLGVEFSFKFLGMKDGSVVRAQLWDTAGEERFKSVANIYLKGSVGALLVYDVCDRNSFDGLSSWLH